MEGNKLKLNFNNDSALGFNPLYKKQGLQTIKKLDIVQKIEDNIKRKSDIVEISEQGQLKLKLRNLEQATILEERSEEIKENINDRIKLFESAKTTIQDIMDLVKKSIEEDFSLEDREQIQSNIKDIIADIDSLVNEAIKNNPNFKLDDVDINNINKTDNNILNIDSEQNSIENSKNNQEDINIEKLNEKFSLEETKEDDNKMDLNKINILENPKDALTTLGNALEAIMQEIIRLAEQLGELEKNIQKLLGEYDERKELKSLDKLEDIVNDKNDESVQESQGSSEK